MEMKLTRKEEDEKEEETNILRVLFYTGKALLRKLPLGEGNKGLTEVTLSEHNRKTDVGVVLQHFRTYRIIVVMIRLSAIAAPVVPMHIAASKNDKAYNMIRENIFMHVLPFKNCLLHGDKKTVETFYRYYK
uniref:Uncharacterized protein n=1 Tax=Vespula pensylvanica TaxID=30213 RepID=A0A834KNA0_VESPE|nr:hypothetical protein H0235_013884 [Vespula pensylvanica]